MAAAGVSVAGCAAAGVMVGWEFWSIMVISCSFLTNTLLSPIFLHCFWSSVLRVFSRVSLVGNCRVGDGSHATCVVCVRGCDSAMVARGVASEKSVWLVYIVVKTDRAVVAWCN